MIRTNNPGGSEIQFAVNQKTNTIPWINTGIRRNPIGNTVYARFMDGYGSGCHMHTADGGAV